MRRILAVLLALSAIALVTPGAQAARTPEELRPLALRLSDLGPGFQPFTLPGQAGAAEQFPGHAALFQRFGGVLDPTMWLVANGLIDAAVAEELELDPAALIGGLRELGVDITVLEPPALGQEPHRFRLSGAYLGLEVTGELITWRRQDVIASVAVARVSLPGTPDTGGVAALDLALTQDQRLVSALGQ